MYKIEKAGQKFTDKTIIGGQKIMNEQNHNNEKKVERVSTPSAKTSAKKQSIWHKIKKMNKENKFYLYTAVSCAAVLMAIVVVALAISNNGGVNQEAGKGSASHSSSVEKPDSSENSTENKPVVNTPEGMIMPVGTVMLGSDYGFYYNQTLNSYYEHAGVDFMATAGTEVFAAEDGTIESIYKYSGRPFVVTEFFAKGSDAVDMNGYALGNQSNAGWNVDTQTDRAIHFENYTLLLIESKSCVGWTWYRFRDNDQTVYRDEVGNLYVAFDIAGAAPSAYKNIQNGNIIDGPGLAPSLTVYYKGESDLSNVGSNKGIYDNKMNIYTELAGSYKKIYDNVFALIDYFDEMQS